jgi:hypothetical protein
MWPLAIVAFKTPGAVLVYFNLYVPGEETRRENSPKRNGSNQLAIQPRMWV